MTNERMIQLASEYILHRIKSENARRQFQLEAGLEPNEHARFMQNVIAPMVDDSHIADFAIDAFVFCILENGKPQEKTNKKLWDAIIDTRVHNYMEYCDRERSDRSHVPYITEKQGGNTHE